MEFPGKYGDGIAEERFEPDERSFFDAVIGQTLDGRIQNWNPAAETMYGYSAEEALGQPITLIVPDDRRDELVDAMQRVRQGEIVAPFDTVRVRRDGVRLNVSVSMSPIKQPSGRIVGFSSVDRGRSGGEGIDAERARLAAIVDSSFDAIIAKDLDGTITAWNRGAEQIYGYSAAEAVGRNISLIVPEDRLAELERIMAEVRSARRVEPFDTVRVRKDGVQIDVSVTLSPIYNNAREMVGISAIGRDISEQKQAKLIAQKNERQQALAADLGTRALSGESLDQVITLAIRHLVQTLDADAADVVEPTADGSELQLRGAAGWDGETAGAVVGRADAGMPAALAIRKARDVLVRDLTADDRCADAARLRERGMASVAVVPIPGEQRPLGALGVYARRTDAFTSRDVSFLQSVANVLAHAMYRRLADERQRLLVRELDHRMKNTFKVVDVMAKQTLKRSRSFDEFQSAFEGRLHSMARTHELLIAREWRAVDVETLLRRTFDIHQESVELDCDPIELDAETGAALSMAVYELVTNAAKYGGLAAPDGALRVEVRRVRRNEAAWLRLAWQESTVAPVQPPAEEGFGYRMVRRVVESQLRGTAAVDYQPHGVSWQIEIPL